MLKLTRLWTRSERNRHVVHDDLAPDVGHLDRAAVHAVRWQSSVESVPLAGGHQGRSRLQWGLQSGTQQMHVQADE
jgi:hypothetical protein